MPARAGLAALAAIALAGPASPAAAQMTPCRDIRESGFVIRLDDIFETTEGKVLPLMSSLQFRVSANLEQLRVESDLPLKVVRCENRRPADPSAFTRSLVEQLNAGKVLLEVWGRTAAATDQTGAPIQEATVGYVLVPVRFDEITKGYPRGAFLLSRQAKSTTSLDELVRLVDQSGELAAYATLTAGVRLLQSKDYNQALKQLCRSKGLLARVAGTAPSANDKALITYVEQLASETVTRAKADPAYDGALKRLPIGIGGCQ